MTYKYIRITVFTLVMLVLFNQVQAQDEESGSSLRYGARIGATVSSFSNSQPHTGVKVGYTIGAIVEYKVSSTISAQIEPSYLQQGGSYVRFSDDSRFGTGSIYDLYTTSSNITVHSLDLPLLFKYNFPAKGDLKLNVVVGPAIAYTLGATNHYETTFYEDQTFSTVNSSRNESSQYEPFNVGVTAGVGTEISLGTKSLMIDFRYRYGLTPAKKGYSYIDLYAVQGDLMTNTAYITVGVSF